MKQLKFMIAAAAAIGLAGAAQADFPSATEKDALGNTGFEEFEVGDAGIDVTTGTAAADENSYFIYAGTVEADNESKIIKGSSGLTENEKSGRAKGDKFDDDQNVLQVNTGTEPLLRTINRAVVNEGQEPSSAAVSVPNDTGIYIDTLVQFTVTPAGDTVTPTADDKLMIYLQEVAPVMAEDGKTVATPGATNLMVKCCMWVPGDPTDLINPTSDSFTTNELGNVVTASGVTILPGEWYRLTVKSGIVEGKTVFSAWINNVALESATPLITTKSEKIYFPSLQPQVATLKAVGFAGEGLVDDIVFSTTLEEIVTSVDFTLTYQGATDIKAVIGNVEYPLTSGKFVLPGDATSFTITYDGVSEGFWNPQYSAELSNASACTVNGLEVTITGANPSASLTVTATEGNSAPTVGENVTGVDFGITNDAFKNDSGEALKKVVDWAFKAGLTKAQLNEMAPFEDETGNATNELQEAFLLNCAVSELAAAKAAFKVGALTFDQDGNPVTPAAATSWVDSNDNEIEFNAVPAVLGASELGGTWETATKAHKFFKAVLTK